jgi:hypothetical protein
LYVLPNNVIKPRVRWVENVAHMGQIRNAYEILIRKPEWKRPLERPRYRWKDDIRQIGWERVDWIHLAQD